MVEADQVWGPVITAIDAGHFSRTPNKGERHMCGECRVPWDECKVIRRARKQQATYADHLRLSRLTSAETRRTYI